MAFWSELAMAVNQCEFNMNSEGHDKLNFSNRSSEIIENCRLMMQYSSKIFRKIS